MSVDRRQFVQQWAVAGLAGMGLASCAKPPKREQVLASLAREVVTADVADVVAESRDFEAALGRFLGAPGREALVAARDAWKRAMLAWKRAYCFRSGPLVDTNALLRTTFWPVRPAAIDAALAAPTPVDDAFVEELGVDAKGLFAIEALLFPEQGDTDAVVALFAGAEHERRRSFMAALARHVSANATRAAGVLGNGHAFAEQFAAGGQQSLNRLIGQMVSTVENVASNRLNLVLGLDKSHMLRPSQVEGWPSGTSQAIALALLIGTQRLYDGEGRLSELVKAAAPAIDQRIRSGFAAAVVSVEKLGAPLEQIVKVDRGALEAAVVATKALEVAMKVDLASALGITITFQSGDGD